MPRIRLSLSALAALAAALVVGSSSDAGQDEVGVSSDLLVVGSSFETDVAVFPDRLEVPRQGHEDLLDMRAGKLLAGGPARTERNPHGFLRRANGVRVSGDTLVIDTGRPLLTDLFHGHARVEATGADAAGAPLSSSTLHTESWASKIGGAVKLPLQLSLLSIVASLLDPVRANEKFAVGVTLSNGSFSFQPSVNAAVEVKKGELEHLVISAEGRMEGEVVLDIDVKATGNLGTSKNGLLQPLRIDRRLVQWRPAHALQWVGGVPVWETIELSLVLRCDLAFNGEVKTKVKVKVSADGIYGAEYRRGNGWSPIKKVPTLDPTGSTIEIDEGGTEDVKCALEPQVALLIYDLAGPTLALGPYANVHTDDIARTWSLQPGFRADVGVLIEFAHYQILSERFNIVDVPLGQPLTGSF